MNTGLATRTFILLVLACSPCPLLGQENPLGGGGENPLDSRPAWAGTFADQKVKAEFSPSSDGFSGTITVGGASHPARGTISSDGRRLTGSFTVGQRSFDLTAVLEGQSTLLLTSGGSTYRLLRQEEANPLSGGTGAAPQPSSQPSSALPAGPDLSHVRVGQRYVFSMNASGTEMQMIFEVTGVTQVSVSYLTRTLMKMPGQSKLSQVGDPTPAEVNYAAGDSSHSNVRQTRETIQAAGEAWDCIVYEVDGSRTWVPQRNGQATWPPCVKIQGPQLTQILTEIQGPRGASPSSSGPRPIGGQPTPGSSESGEAWANRVIQTVNRRLQDANYRQNLASVVQAQLHPTGGSPSMGQTQAGLRMGTRDKVVVRLSVNWKGGVVGTNYTTTIDWVLTQGGQEAVQVIGDNSPVVPTATAKQELLKTLEPFFNDLISTPSQRGGPSAAWATQASQLMNRLLQDPGYRQNLANAVQAFLHPSGGSPSMGQAQAGLRMGETDKVVVRLSVNWKGGIVGSGYTTTVDWVLSQNGQVALEVAADNATVGATDSARQELLAHLEQYYNDLKLRMR